jgi:hypothetical protein
MPRVDRDELQRALDRLELGYIDGCSPPSNPTCLLKTSATVCGTLIAAPVGGVPLRPGGSP